MKIDPTEASLLRNFAQTRQHSVFDATPKHTTTQQERIHLDRGFVGLEDHETSKPVIAESVADANRQNLRFAGQTLDFGLRTPASGAVELVGSLGELRNALELFGLHRLDRGLDLQTRQENGQTPRLVPEILPVLILA